MGIYGLYLVHDCTKQNQDCKSSFEDEGIEDIWILLNFNCESKIYSLLKNIQCIRYS